MLVENQPRNAKHARLQARRDQRLHERLAGLEILAADRDVAVSCARSSSAGTIGGQVRRAVGERHAGFQRGVRVDLAGRDLRVVLHESFFERRERLVHRRRRVWNTSVEPHQIMTRREAPVVCLEVPDVVHQHSALSIFAGRL